MLDDYVRETIARVAQLLGDRLPAHPRGQQQEAIVQALRQAEAASGGPLRDLWGHAAANAHAAAWIGAEAETARDLWATVLDYAERASEAENAAV